MRPSDPNACQLAFEAESGPTVSVSTVFPSGLIPARGGVSLLIKEPRITLAAGTKEARLRQKDHACRSCN